MPERTFYIVKKFYRNYHDEDDYEDEDATVSFYGTSAEVSAFIVAKTSDEDRIRRVRLLQEMASEDTSIELWRKKKALWLTLSEDERKLLGVNVDLADIYIKGCETRKVKLQEDMDRNVIHVGDAYWIETEDKVERNWTISDTGFIQLRY